MARGKVCTVHITGLASGDGWFSEQRLSDTNAEWRDALRDARNNKTEARVFCLCKRQDEDLSLRRLKGPVPDGLR